MDVAKVSIDSSISKHRIIKSKTQTVVKKNSELLQFYINLTFRLSSTYGNFKSFLKVIVTDYNEFFMQNWQGFGEWD